VPPPPPPLCPKALYGEPTVVVPAGPGSASTYELVYSPLTAGVSMGSVAFLNEKAGEFWYEVRPKKRSFESLSISVYMCKNFNL